MADVRYEVWYEWVPAGPRHLAGVCATWAEASNLAAYWLRVKDAYLAWVEDREPYGTVQ